MVQTPLALSQNFSRLVLAHLLNGHLLLLLLLVLLLRALESFKHEVIILQRCIYLSCGKISLSLPCIFLRRRLLLVFLFRFQFGSRVELELALEASRSHLILLEQGQIFEIHSLAAHF